MLKAFEIRFLLKKLVKIKLRVVLEIRLLQRVINHPRLIEQLVLFLNLCFFFRLYDLLGTNRHHLRWVLEYFLRAIEYLLASSCSENRWSKAIDFSILFSCFYS